MASANTTDEGYSATLLVSFAIPSLILTMIVLSRFSIQGVPFLILLVFSTLWLSMYAATSLSLYKKGGLFWGSADAGMSTAFIFDSVVLVLAVFVFLGSRLTPKKLRPAAQGNLAKSLTLGLIVPTSSAVPFAILVWAIVQFFTECTSHFCVTG